MTGSLVIVGLGPDRPELMTPPRARRFAAATDLVGYGPYLDRVPASGAGQCRHASDNRVELERARHALTLAAEGRHVAVVSGGDPGRVRDGGCGIRSGRDGRADVAEARYSCRAGRYGDARCGGRSRGRRWAAISARSRCRIILKSWATIEQRLKAAAEADFVIALYNPASKARPHQLGQAFALLREVKSPETVVLFVRAAGTDDVRRVTTTLAKVDPAVADMRTLVIIGASTTRLIARDRRRALGLHAPPRGSTRIIQRFQPGKSAACVCNWYTSGLERPRDHHDGNAECARCCDLRICRGATRVLRHDSSTRSDSSSARSAASSNGPRAKMKRISGGKCTSPGGSIERAM